MKIKKILIMSVCLLLVAVFSFGCTSTATPSASPSASQAASSEAPASQTPVDTAKSSVAAVPANITFTCMQSGTYDVAAKEVADQLKAQNINVSVEAFPYATLRQKNTTDIVTNTNAYDAVSGSYYLSDLYPNYAPIKSYLDKTGYANTLIPGILDKCEKYNGDLIGVPYGADAYGLMYRTDLFEQYGIQIPKTMADLEKAITDLKQKLPKGIAPYAFSVGATEQLIGPFLPIYNGYYINKEGKFQLEADKATTALQTLMDRFKMGPDNMSAYTIDQMNALFLQGNVAIIEGWPSFITGVVNDPTKSKIVGKWGIIPYPQDNGGFSWLSLWNIFINKNSKNTDAALKWATTYTSQENATAQFVKYGIGSCHSASYKDPTVVQKYGQAFLNGQAANLAFAKNPPLSGEANDYMCQTFGDAFAGKITAADAIQRINDKFATLTVPASTLAQANTDGLVEK